MLKFKQIIVGGVLALMPQLAFGYAMTHDYYNRYRSPYTGNVYLQQLAHYSRASATSVLSDKSEMKDQFNGYTLHTAVGIEHARFIQTGVFYTNVQQNGLKDRLQSLSGHEFGGEVKVVLQSPIANIVLGGGMFYAMEQTTREDESGRSQRSDLTGQGYRGSLEVVYYTSSRMSLVVSLNQVIVSLNDKSQSRAVSSVKVQSTRAGAGLSLWL